MTGAIPSSLFGTPQIHTNVTSDDHLGEVAGDSHKTAEAVRVNVHVPFGNLNFIVPSSAAWPLLCGRMFKDMACFLIFPLFHLRVILARLQVGMRWQRTQQPGLPPIPSTNDPPPNSSICRP